MKKGRKEGRKKEKKKKRKRERESKQKKGREGGREKIRNSNILSYSFPFCIQFFSFTLSLCIDTFLHKFNSSFSINLFILSNFIFRFNNDDVIGSCEIAMADVFETLQRRKALGETEEYDFNLPIYSNGSANGRLQVRTPPFYN